MNVRIPEHPREVKIHSFMTSSHSSGIRLLSLISAALLTLHHSASAMTAEEVYAKASESVVVVKGLDTSGKTKQLGSGVVIAVGEVISNCHVLKDADTFQVGRKGKFHPAMVLYQDQERDLCMLVAPEIDAKPANLGKAKDLKIGAVVYAIGAPRGLELSLSNGIVSQLHNDKGTPLIQTTAAISPGSSGGGLFDQDGRWVGVTTFYYKGGQNLNFALPIEWVSELRASKYFLTRTTQPAPECAPSVEPEAADAAAPAAPAPEAVAPAPEPYLLPPEPDGSLVDASWNLVSESDDALIYLRKSTIRIFPMDRKAAWFLFDNKKAQLNLDKIEYYLSAMHRYLFDCTNRTMGVLSAIEKSGSAAHGNTVSSFDVDEWRVSFSHAVPDSVGEAMLEAVCE